jgi:integrase
VQVLFLACEAFGYNPFGLSENELVDVVLFFALSRSIFSIDSFLTALSQFYASFGKLLPRSPPLNLLKSGLKRLFLSADAPHKAFPLGKEAVLSILQNLDVHLAAQVFFGAWLSIAFLFALRPQDFTTLRWKDVSILDDGSLDLSVLSAKGVKHRPTSVFSAPPSSSILSPQFWLSHVSALFDTPPDDNDFIFAYRDQAHPETFGKLIPVRVFASWLRSFYGKFVNPLIPPKLTAYSLRRGSATAYHQAGVKDLLLSQMMRHKDWSTTAGYVDYYSASSTRQAFSSALLGP